MTARTDNLVGGKVQAREGKGSAARRDAFRKASHHSRRVKLLKVVLPVLALAMGGGFVAYSWMSTPAELSFDISKTSYADGKLVMANPKLEGFSKGELPYAMSALQAVQSAESSGVFELEAIDAKLPLDADSWATVQAPRGIYNRDNNTIDFTGDVLITTTDGMKAKFSKAFFDIGKGDLKTSDPVDIDAGGTQIAADSMMVLENGKVLIFEKRVRMQIAPDQLHTGGETTGETNGG